MGMLVEIGIGIGGAAWSGRVGEARELWPRTFGLGKQQRLGTRVRFGGVRCELLFGPFASGPAWSCGRDEEALEVVPVRAGSSLGSWTRFWASSGLDQRKEGLVDLAVAGEMGGRRQGAGSVPADCLVLSSRGVAARRLSSGPVGAGTSEGCALTRGWPGVGTGLERSVGGGRPAA